MNSALATILATAALLGVGGLYLKVDRLADDLGKTRTTPGERAGAGDSVLASGSRSARPRTVQRELADPGGRPEVVEPMGGDSSDESLTERITRLEVAERKRSERRRSSPGPGMRLPRFVRSVDQLARQLKLTPTQKDRVKDSVERGKRRGEEILKIPDETGTSPFERRQERQKKIKEAITKGEHGNMLRFVQDQMAVYNRKIPGRDATYGEELKRIRKETRDEIDASLNAQQRKELEGTNIDGLVGGPGGGVPMAISVFRSESDGDRGGGMFVSTGVTEIAVESGDGKAKEGGGGSDTESDEDSDR